MSSELDAVKRGYVLIEMNERGHFFPKQLRDSRRTADGLDDELNWMSAQPWSNGR